MDITWSFVFKTHISLNCFYFQSHNCLLKFLVKHKIFFVFRFRLPKGSPAPHFFTASGGKNFLSSRKIFRPAQAPLRLSSSDNAKVRIFHHPCKHFAQKQHFFHPISLPILQRNSPLAKNGKNVTRDAWRVTLRWFFYPIFCQFQKVLYFCANNKLKQWSKPIAYRPFAPPLGI